MADVYRDDTGIFWIGEREGVRVLVQITDGCSINGNFWVSHRASGSQQYTLRVEDTRTGTVRSYNQATGSVTTDDEAFANCP